MALSLRYDDFPAHRTPEYTQVWTRQGDNGGLMYWRDKWVQCRTDSFMMPMTYVRLHQAPSLIREIKNRMFEDMPDPSVTPNLLLIIVHPQTGGRMGVGAVRAKVDNPDGTGAKDLPAFFEECFIQESLSEWTGKITVGSQTAYDHLLVDEES